MTSKTKPLKLEIVRPDLSRFAKNMDWSPRGNSVEYMRDCLYGRTNAATHTICDDLCYYKEFGSVVSISQEVSRALEASKVSKDSLKDIPFPAQSMEFVWEDPDLPNLVVTFNAKGNGVQPLPCLVVITTLADCSPNSFPYACSIFTLDSLMLEDVLGGKLGNIYADETAEEEAKQIAYINELVLKVLAYIAVPEVKKITGALKTKAERKAANLLSRGRDAPVPAGGLIHLRNLPRVVTQNDSEAEDPQGTPQSSRKFLGRVGHVRYFKSDFYTKVRGTWKWIPPIAPPEGIKLRFVVNKVPKAA